MLKNLKYAVLIAVPICFLSNAASASYAQNSQNIVSIEAENGDLTGDGGEWSLNSGASGASGTGSYSAVSTNWSVGDSAELSYSFSTHTAGSYKVLLRSKANASGTKSLWINLDGQYLSSQNNNAAYFNHGSWQWSDFWGVTTSYLNPGDHELKLYVRKSTFDIDKIVIVPISGTGSDILAAGDTGMGPNETIVTDPGVDTDGDGVFDSADDCPLQAGPAYNNGCPVDSGTGYVQNSVNIVSMEAENGELSGDGGEWSLNLGSSGSSGTGSFSAISTNWKAGDSAVLSYNFSTHTAGNYKVLLRSMATASGTKSIWINLDGEYLSSQNNNAAYFSHRNWQWNDGYGVTTSYLEAGSHELKLYVRKSTFDIDKIVIVPVSGTGSGIVSAGDTGFGPAETFGSSTDTDNDGVIDSEDDCPTVAGPASNNGCPLPVDTDGDGVVDTEDDCPTVAGPASNNGCPLPVDTDGDGVVDTEDDCPTVAGPASNNGCPLDSGSGYVQNSQNIVSMEAENGELSGNGGEWSLNTGSSGASGAGSYSAVSTNWKAGDSAVLSYNFSTHTAGTYKVLLRSKATATGTKSMWINLDGEYLSSQNNNAAYFSHRSWQWNDGFGVTTSYLEAGTHELKLYVRKSTFEIDKIVIVPTSGTGSDIVLAGDTGTGPNETIGTSTDSDGDGVPDTEDNCPNIAGPASNGGCPLVSNDTDGDGVIDSEDECPAVAGPASNYGCPLGGNQWQAPTEISLANTDSDGSPNASGWAGGTHSFNTGVALHNRAFSWAGGFDYSGKSFNFTRTNYIPVQAGHLYVVSMMVRADEQHPPIMGLQVSLRDASYGVVTEHVSRVGIGQPNEWRNAVVSVQIPDDGSVTQMRLGFNRFFDSSPRGTTGNAYIDEIKLFDYGRDRQAGSIWLKAPPKDKLAFNSGSNEITVSATGAWRLNNAPFIVKGAYPDNSGREASSAQRAFDAGFNTLYQVNPMAGQLTWAPDGMKVMADVTSVVLPGNGWYQNWSLLESAVDDIVGNYSDVVIAYYVDIELEVWQSRAAMQEMANRIRARETALGSFHRPILAHSQHVAGIEAFDHIFDLYESKDNPAYSDFGVTNPNPGYYDTLQSSIGYITQTHPEIETITSTAVFNIPHLGSYLDVWLVDSVIKGGSGYGIFADRPGTQTWGHQMGFVDQPWWSTINASNAALDALYPAMQALATNEYAATVSGAQDGYSGVSKTFRVVGNEVWVMLANKGPTARTAAITTPDDITGFAEVWSPRSSGSKTGARTLSVQLQPFGAYVARFTPQGL